MSEWQKTANRGKGKGSQGKGQEAPQPAARPSTFEAVQVIRRRAQQQRQQRGQPQTGWHSTDASDEEIQRSARQTAARRQGVPPPPRLSPFQMHYPTQARQPAHAIEASPSQTSAAPLLPFHARDQPSPSLQSNPQGASSAAHPTGEQSGDRWTAAEWDEWWAAQWQEAQQQEQQCSAPPVSDTEVESQPSAPAPPAQEQTATEHEEQKTAQDLEPSQPAPWKRRDPQPLSEQPPWPLRQKRPQSWWTKE